MTTSTFPLCPTCGREARTVNYNGGCSRHPQVRTVPVQGDLVVPVPRPAPAVTFPAPVTAPGVVAPFDELGPAARARALETVRSWQGEHADNEAMEVLQRAFDDRGIFCETDWDYAQEPSDPEAEVFVLVRGRFAASFRPADGDLGHVYGDLHRPHVAAPPAPVEGCEMTVDLRFGAGVRPGTVEFEWAAPASGMREEARRRVYEEAAERYVRQVGVQTVHDMRAARRSFFTDEHVEAEAVYVDSFDADGNYVAGEGAA